VSLLDEAAERVRDVGELLVERSGVEPGMEVLDVGTGTGNAALPAAKVGARVTGMDDAGELLAIARERGADEMIELDWVEGEVESLPFGDRAFDRVLSAFGHMFAPDHEAVARELRRVCRDDGSIALAAWTPEGLGGQMLSALAGHLPPPSDYSSAPSEWGDADHVRELLGEEVEFETRTLELEAESPEQWFEFVAQSVGPFIQARELLDEGGFAAMRTDLVALFREANRAEGDGACRLEQEYLVAVARRSANTGSHT
jgi:ubiquinone/menaquinone biosynthesis C-methylase UbiE